MTEITDERFTHRRNEAKIAAEQQLDGIYIVRSNVEPEQRGTLAANTMQVADSEATFTLQTRPRYSSSAASSSWG